MSIPVIGMGGVVTTDDALQFLMAGASAVQVGTTTFREPRTAERIVDGLGAYLESRGFTSVSERRRDGSAGTAQRLKWTWMTSASETR